MKINPQGCEYYRLDITSDPDIPAGDWELSLDGDAWVSSTLVDGLPAWLIAGEEFSESGVNPDFVVGSAVQPLLRAKDNPETIIRRAPKIYPGTIDASKKSGCC